LNYQHRSSTWFVLKNVLSANPSSYWKSFINIPVCLTVVSINARSATKMMLQPTGIRILRKSGLTIERGGKTQNASRHLRKFQKHGEQRIEEGQSLTMPWLEPSAMAVYFGNHASDVEKSSPSLITRITTKLLKSSGFANHVTNNVTKN
jgi:hypothetical protein